MLVNKKYSDMGVAIVDAPTRKAVATKVMNATVLLRGGGKDYFTGSGVILGPGKAVKYDTPNQKWAVVPETKFTVVVSALHNLDVQGDKTNQIPPLDGNTITWKQSYAQGFAADVKIVYGNGSQNMAWGKAPQATANIDYVVPIFAANIGTANKMITILAAQSADGNEFQLVNLKGPTTPDGTPGPGGPDAGITPAGNLADSWSYDVVLLLSKDPSLYAYATKADNCDFMAGVDLKEIAQTMVDDWDNEAKMMKTPVLGSDYYLAPFGYGKTSDPNVSIIKNKKVEKTKLPAPTSSGTPERLQYRVCDPGKRLSAATATKFYLNTEFKLPNNALLVQWFEGGLLLECGEGNNSTFSGDSGGPVIAFPTGDSGEAFLVGVNTGAGVALSDADARKTLLEDGVWEYSNNVATSLGKFYDDLNDLRFQNV